MNISKFFFLLFLLVATVLHIYISRYNSTSPLLSYGLMASSVLAYLFLNYVVYQVKFHHDEDEE